MLLPRAATTKKYRPKIEVFSTRPNHSISSILLNRSEVACRPIINFVHKLDLKLLIHISIQLSTQGILSSQHSYPPNSRPNQQYASQFSPVQIQPQA